MRTSDHFSPDLERRGHKNQPLVEEWSPQQITRFRQIARNASSFKELASKAGMTHWAAVDMVKRLQMPFSENMRIMKMVQKGQDATGSEMMDRIDGLTAKRRQDAALARRNGHIQILVDPGTPGHERHVVSQVIALSESYHDVAPGTVKGGAVTDKAIEARQGAIKVARVYLPNAAYTHMARLFGGKNESVIRRALGKPDAPFQDFIDHARKVLS